MRTTLIPHALSIDSLIKAIGAIRDGLPLEAPSESLAAAAAPSPPPRVAFVCHTGYFQSGSYGGATRASLAMLREARRICGSASGGGGVDVLALVQTPIPQHLAYRLEGDKLGVLTWEGERVVVGRSTTLKAALAERMYDVIVSFSVEPIMLEFALELRTRVLYATPHNYYLPPFGPFRRFEVAPGHHAMLQRLDALLSPCGKNRAAGLRPAGRAETLAAARRVHAPCARCSLRCCRYYHALTNPPLEFPVWAVHHCEYLQRWGPSGLTTRPLYAADYHYFHEESGEGGGDGEGGATSALPDLSDDHSTPNALASSSSSRNTRSIRLPLAMSPWLAPHKYVTIVSPSPEKGLSVFSTLARRMPNVQFAAVATQWTGAETVAKLQSLGPNVRPLLPSL